MPAVSQLEDAIINKTSCTPLEIKTIQFVSKDVLTQLRGHELPR